jgi:aminomethyltransferase
MGWVVRLEKEDFIGRHTLSANQRSPRREALVGLVVEGEQTPEDGSAVMVNGRPAGRVTSARYSPHVGAPIALAWVPETKAVEGAQVDVRVRGRAVAARVTLEAFYDPEGARLRA